MKKFILLILLGVMLVAGCAGTTKTTVSDETVVSGTTVAQLNENNVIGSGDDATNSTDISDLGDVNSSEIDDATTQLG
ncbi:MAG: hypothetical protein Q7S22_05815 [Candidatus Micrarchaeota archaeon]|nr:hypothetical protein [Candidatus Micrarchaeota archaeon]